MTSKMECLELAEEHRQKAENAVSEYLKKFHTKQMEFWKKMAN